MNVVRVRNPVVRVQPPEQATDSVIVVPGRTGDQGVPGIAGNITLSPFEYLMPVAQTTATFSHTLGRDPVAVQVFVDGVLCDEYTVVFPTPGSIVRVGFDVSVIAKIRIF